MTKNTQLLSLALLALVGFAVKAPAQAISWQTPVTISGDGNVDIAGTFLYAYGLGGSGGDTVNGVTFSSGPLGGNTDFTTSNLDGAAFFGPSATAAPYSDLSASYEDLVGHGDYATANSGVGTATLTLNGLTNGDSYQVQVFVNDSRTFGAGRSETFTGGGSTSGALSYNSTGADGGVGQFVIGTFTADGSSEDITLASTQALQLNAFQVREEGATPEPSTYAMVFAGLGLLALVSRLRKLA
jgi:hypothetical protein